jgi:hypothetical protein
MASALLGLPDRRTFSLQGRSSWFALLIRQFLRHRTLRTSSYALIGRTWHATFCRRSRRTEFLRVFKSFRRRVSRRVSIQLLPHILIPRFRCLHSLHTPFPRCRCLHNPHTPFPRRRCLHNPHTHFPRFRCLHTFQQPHLPYFPVPSSPTYLLLVAMPIPGWRTPFKHNKLRSHPDRASHYLIRLFPKLLVPFPMFFRRLTKV